MAAEDLLDSITRSFKSLLLLATAIVPGSFLGTPERTYTNPILPGNHADPWIFKHNNAYYLTPSMPDGTVGVFKSYALDNFTGIAPSTVWVPPNTTTGVWAPELHYIDGEFYIYCALQDGEDEHADRRMHVLRGTDPNDPTKPFTHVGQITTKENQYAIDGTVLQHNGKKYFIWSGKENNVKTQVQYLYIAEMDTPYSIPADSERVLLHSPYSENGTRNEWHWHDIYGIDEGPQIIVNGEQTFLVYSACASWMPCYSLAIMGLKSPTADPVDPASWWSKEDGPVFSSSKETVGTGHASFTEDANGVPYIAYHAWDVDAPAHWSSRQVRAQPFHFGEDGLPVFPEAVASGVNLPGAAGFQPEGLRSDEL
ncbi:Arabinanase/levansucrase/invertase superfamily protein [Mycena chlorophos]|uniref:Arabinanase/levansucrase/invertase superfamily protein n=1 Tax=Mycena chlorophos TaxID=658473 RepID=A0A8H6TQ60_MYCCL|nr:Arabinanase/levansucrase/invertase superfamily protein [Mycena chlorophos]